MDTKKTEDEYEKTLKTDYLIDDWFIKLAVIGAFD